MLTEAELQAVTEQMPDLWGLLSDEEKQTFAEMLNIQVYRKHQMVYHEGESPDHLLCLLSGKVKIFREGVGGRSQIMRIMAPGQYFGYRASLAAEPYVTAATAFEESKICAIPMGVVKEAMLHNNSLCQFFIRELATDLGIADRRTVSLMVTFVNQMTGTEFYVADDRVDEYLKAGFKPAYGYSESVPEAEEPSVEEPETKPKKPRATRKKK